MFAHWRRRAVIELKARSAEAAEAELTRFIERRDDLRRRTEGERQAEELWRESVARFHERSEAEMRSRWIEYEQHMSELHTRLAEEHREKAQKLLEESDDRKEVA
jgi:hypothetical protein